MENRNSRLVIVSMLVGILAALALLAFIKLAPNVGAAERPTHKPPYSTPVNEWIVGVRWLPADTFGEPPQAARVVWSGVYGMQRVCIFRVNETVNQFDPFNPTHESDPDADYFIACVDPGDNNDAIPLDVDGGYDIRQLDQNLRAQPYDRFKLVFWQITSDSATSTTMFTPRLPAPSYARLAFPLVAQP